MNKPVYLVLTILKINKTLMYEFWYDYIKPKYQYNARLCYMDTDSLIIHIKIEDVYEDIADDVILFWKTSKSNLKKGEKQDKAIEEHEKLLIKSSSEKESITYLRQKIFWLIF